MTPASDCLQQPKAADSISNLPTIATLRGLSPHDQLAPFWAAVRRREMEDCLAILDRDAAALPCRAEREMARRAAEEVWTGRDRAPEG